MITQISARAARQELPATQVIAATGGILCGLSGLEHGFFETLQGHAAPSALMISAMCLEAGSRTTQPIAQLRSSQTLHDIVAISPRLRATLG